MVVEGEYSTLSSQFLVSGSWFLVPGSRFLVPGSRFSVLGSWFLVLGSRLLSSAIEIASGRLFAGRPPAWTLPRRPHRRLPGAKRPLRRGFNRTPEQLPTFQRSTLPRSNLQRSTFNLQPSTSSSTPASGNSMCARSLRRWSGLPPVARMCA